MHDLFLSIFIILYESGHIVALVACCLVLGPWFMELRRLQLVAIDQDPWTEALPVITHDLELSCDGQELARGRVTYFYCEFFH